MTADRLTTLLRVLWVLPIAVILSLVAATGGGASTGGAFFGGLWLATMLMLAFRVGTRAGGSASPES